MATATMPAAWGGVYVDTALFAAIPVFSAETPPKVMLQRPLMFVPESVTSWLPVAGPLFTDRLPMDSPAGSETSTWNRFVSAPYSAGSLIERSLAPFASARTEKLPLPSLPTTTKVGTSTTEGRLLSISSVIGAAGGGVKCACTVVIAPTLVVSVA